MKSIIVLFDDENKYETEKVFGGKSALEITNQRFSALNLPLFTVKKSECGTLTDLLCFMKAKADENQADSIIFSYADLPFINSSLINEVIDFHTNYVAEYTFADGYPYGFAPEILNAGACGILAELSKTTQNSLGSKTVSRECIFDLIKTDINSFEVETVLADNDWRLYRFNFSCGRKEFFIASKELWAKTEEKSAQMTAEELSKIASETAGILKTVPGYYNIQIAEKCEGKCSYCPYPKCYEAKNGSEVSEAKELMKFEDFSKLVDQINDFSENAVINLSAWGEPFNHPEILTFIKKILTYKGLSVFIETDGMLVSDEFCAGLAEIVNAAEERTNGWAKVMISVSMDAFTDGMYKTIHGTENALQKAAEIVAKLNNAIPGNVYPQFVRTNENEEELESFYRYWNEKSNPSAGNLIIQKYDDFAGLLPECKPADLSPLERNVCWHIRRDLNILFNGDVTVCRAYVLDGIAGNVFAEGIESVWKKLDSVLQENMDQKYNEKCRKCDEWYTFNF